MSNTIDRRIVEMQFNNAQFESNAKTSMSTLEKLKQLLNFGGASKGFESINSAANNCKMTGLSSAIETVTSKFSALEVMGLTALVNITNSAVNAGKQLVSSLTIDQVNAGWDKYAEKTQAVQTIMAATAKDFTDTGVQMDYVNGQLEKLNWFTDETSYNFLDMVNNIGKFTSNNVKLDTAVTAMEGISTWAAISGANVNEAGRAMYNLSQAISAGAVKLMDWRSIELANMGTAEFKQTALDTAVALGTLTKQGDGLYKTLKGTEVSVSSFSASLQDAWFTSDVLLQTLSQYGDFSDKLYEASEKTGFTATELLQAVTDYQNGTLDLNNIASETGVSVEELTSMFAELGSETMKLGQKSFQAAQEAKTFKEAIDATKDAVSTGWMNTFELIFGNYQEAKQLWTTVANELYDLFASAGEERNRILSDWKDWGGRDIMLEAVSNAWNAFKDILANVRGAFENVFPPMTTEKLIEITQNVRDLTEHFKLSEETMSRLNRIFTGVFSAVDIVWQAIKAVAKGIGDLFGMVDPGGFLEFLAGIGDYIKDLDNSIKSSEAFAKVVSVMTRALGGLGRILSNVGGFLSDVFSKIKDFLSSIDFNSIKDFFNSVGNALKPIGDRIKSLGKTLKNELLKIFEPGNFKMLTNIINEGLFAGILLGIKKFIDSLSSFTKSGGGILGGIKDFLGGLKDTLESFQKSINADILLKIAKAIGILAASMWLLSTIDPLAMGVAVEGLTVAFGELIGSLKLIDKFLGDSKGLVKAAGAMIGISIAIAILAGALKSLSSIPFDKMNQGLFGVGVLLGELVVAASVMSNKVKGLKIGALGIIAFAVAIRILASAIKAFSSLKLDDMVQGLVGVGAALFAFSLFLNHTDLGNIGIRSGIGLIALAAGLKIIASAVKDMGSMDMGKLIQGILGMTAALFAVAMALNNMPKDMVSKGVGLIALAAGLKIIASVVEQLGSVDWWTLGTGIVALALVLAEVAAALNFMQGTLGGATALLIVSAAITVLASALKSLGSTDWWTLGTGLVVLAAALAAVVAAGYFATAAAPGLLALGAAMVGLGIGIGAIIGSIGLLCAGLAMLVASITGLISLFIQSGEQALGAMLTIISTIPMAMQKVAEGLVQMLTVFAENAGQIKDAFVTLLSSFIDGITESSGKIAEGFTALLKIGLQVIRNCVPELVATALVLVSAFLNAITTLIPQLVDTAFKIITGFLNAIRDNIGNVAQAGADIIIAFVNAVSEQSARLADAGFNAVITFINGLTDTINSRTPELAEAIGNLIEAMVNAGVTLLSGAVGAFFNAANTAAGGIPSGILAQIGAVLGAIGSVISSAVSAVAGAIGSFISGGIQLIGGLANGLLSGVGQVVSAISGVVQRGVSAIRGFVGSFISAGRSLIEGLASGIKSGVASAAAAISGGLQGVVEKARAILQINSPSKVFMKIGGSIGEGLSKGIQNGTGTVIKSGAAMANAVITSAKSTLGINSPSKVARDEVGHWIVEGIAEGITENMDDEEAAEKKAENIINAFKKAIDRIKLEGDILDLADVLWGYSDEGRDANFDARMARVFERGKKQIEDARDEYEHAKGAYDTIVSEGLENSDKGREAYKTMLEAEEKYYKTQLDVNDNYFNKIIQNTEDENKLIEGRYDIWLKGEGKRASAEEKAAKRSEMLLERRANLQKNVLAKTDMYDIVVDTYGLESSEAKKALQEAQEARKAVIDIDNEIIDSRSELLESLNKDLNTKLSINSNKQKLYENEETNLVKESERHLNLVKLTGEQVTIQAEIVSNLTKNLEEVAKVYGEESSEYLEATNKLTDAQAKHQDALSNQLKANSETTNFLNDQKSAFMQYMADNAAFFREMGYTDAEIEEFATKATGYKSEYFGMSQEAILDSINNAETVGKTIGEALSDGIQNGASNSVPMITWVSDDNTWSARGGRVLESVASGLEDNKLTLSDEIVSIVTGAYLKAADIISNSEEYQPVIKPVIDLSNAKALGESTGMYSFAISPHTSRQLASGINYTGPEDGIVYDDTKVIEAIERVGERVGALEEVVGNMQIVMDTGAVVGQISPGIDRQLGQTAAYKERGI